MTKPRKTRPQWWRDDPAPPMPAPADLVDLMKEDVGAGLRYEAPRLPDDEILTWWLDAIVAFDERGDLGQLLERLSSVVPPIAWPHIQDFFSRYDLAKKANRPRTPSYARSLAEMRLERALAQYDELRMRGVKREDALADIAAGERIPKKTLRTAKDGKRGSTRRRRRTAVRK